ncbi:phage integrase N-terminal SAM-like domain-containing protein [Pendulispora brunnea]|uniref:Phage integrase N-terminal SAM-like domain-containing protein n=1 Tax=Pendulispora brunnea TaxID=2905690 RepID=A0ABZ2K6N5_9BACT
MLEAPAAKEAAVGVLRDRMMQDLELAGYAERTKRAYLDCIRAFVKFARRSPAEMGSEEVRRWVEHLGLSGVGAGRMHQHIAALRFFYTKTVYRPDAVSFYRTRSFQTGYPWC